jgi:hypothetical protein
MQAIRVKYTVREDFVERNRENIAAVMRELRARGDCGIQYAAFLAPDGKTFRHVLVLANEEAKSVVPGLDSFKHFQSELKQNVEVPPSPENWAWVDGNYEV